MGEAGGDGPGSVWRKRERTVWLSLEGYKKRAEVSRGRQCRAKGKRSRTDFKGSSKDSCCIKE